MENKKQPYNLLLVMKVAGAFLAFLIGSGFATGQEAMQFFTSFGPSGIFGACITVILFVYLVLRFMHLGKEKGFKTNIEVFKYYFGNVLGTLVSWYVIFLFVAVSAIMLAGSGATLQQAYGIPTVAGAGIMAVIALGTILLGLNKLIDIIGSIGPVIIIMTVIIALITIFKDPGAVLEGLEKVKDLNVMRAAPHWLISSVLYVGLQAVGLASFLPAIGNTIENKRDITLASFVGPILFSTGVAVVSIALLTKIELVYDTQIPILVLASSVLPIYGAIFAVVIFLGIFTTVTPLLWTVISRFAEEKTKKYKMIALGVTGIAYIGGLTLPFAKLVNIFYPTIGYLGLALIVLVLFKDIKKLVNKNNSEAPSDIAQ